MFFFLDFFSKLIKRALGKPTGSEEEEVQNQDTDTEQHESLPEDITSIKEVRPQVSKPSPRDDFQNIVTGVLSKQKIQPKMENMKKGSTDSGETKRVHIQESSHRHKSRTKKTAGHRQKIEDKQLKHEHHSSSKDNSRDSNSSAWSENIPTITISKTESAECILESVDKNENEQPGCSGLDQHKPKIKYALKKQEAQIDVDSISFIGKELGVALQSSLSETTDGAGNAEIEKPSKEIEVQEVEESEKPSVEKHKSDDMMANESIKTESSNDYKEPTITSGEMM